MNRLFALLLALTSSAVAQYATVSATLTDGSGSAVPGAYLHFGLRNCGANYPVVSGQPFTPAKTEFDFQANPATGSITGQVVGNDQILCGNVASTYYEVALMKDALTPLTPIENFVIASNTNWTPAAMPMSNPPGIPGFTYIFGNPTGTQTLSQPTGTKLQFFTFGTGVIDFTNAVVSGLGAGLTPGGAKGYLQSRGPNNNLAGEQIIFADQYASGGAIDAAFTACNATPGCWLIIPPGIWTFSTQVAPTFPTIIQGAGESYQNTGAHCATTLTWTGGAVAPILLSGTAATGSKLTGFCLNNTGGAIPTFVDVDNFVGNTYIDHVAIDYPTVNATVAGMRWGNTGPVNDSHVSNVFLRNTAPVEFQLLDIGGEWKGYNDRAVGDGTNGPIHPTNEWQLGNATQAVSNFNCFACDSAGNVLNEVGIVVNYGDAINFFGLYCEQNGASSHCLQIPNTAAAANAVNLYGPRFQDGLTAATEPLDVELATAKLNVSGGEMVGSNWVNPNYLFEVGACASITSMGDVIAANGSLFSAVGVSGCSENSGPGDTVGGHADQPVISQQPGVGPYNVTATVSAGQAAMTTAGISSGACGAVVSVAVAGVLTTDSITASYASSQGATIGQLVLNTFPTSGHVNLQYCNGTAGTLTPGAINVNWKVTR